VIPGVLHLCARHCLGTTHLFLQQARLGLLLQGLWLAAPLQLREGLHPAAETVLADLTVFWQAHSNSRRVLTSSLSCKLSLRPSVMLLPAATMPGRLY
jgi:hypothetical protein